MKRIADCIYTETNHTICKEEEGKVICFSSNYNLVCDVVEIEKCVFKGVKAGKRCDYLFLFDKNKQEYKLENVKKSIAFYVELKGIDLEEACMQLLNSIENTINEIQDYDISAIVVSSREFNPKYDNNEYFRDVKRIIKKNIQFELTDYTYNIT